MIVKAGASREGLQRCLTNFSICCILVQEGSSRPENSDRVGALPQRKDQWTTAHHRPPPPCFPRAFPLRLQFPAPGESAKSSVVGANPTVRRIRESLMLLYTKTSDL